MRVLTHSLNTDLDSELGTLALKKLETPLHRMLTDDYFVLSQTDGQTDRKATAVARSKS